MEEAIFAQAGAAAVKTPAQPPRKMTTGALNGVSFSNLPPSASTGAPVAAGSAPHNVGLDGGLSGASAKWSEYMQHEGLDDDSPWASLDAFVDNPESSAQFAVPLHLQQQQNIMHTSAQQHAPPSFSQSQPVQHQQPAHTVGRSLRGQRRALATADAVAVRSCVKCGRRCIRSSGCSCRSAAPQHLRSTLVGGRRRLDQLSHIDPATGGASMVDVSHKLPTSRSATAVGRVYLPTSICHLLLTTEPHQGISNKGPVLHTAQLAGIMAAKRTSDLIPLCHPLPLTHVDVKLEVVQLAAEESWIQSSVRRAQRGRRG